MAARIHDGQCDWLYQESDEVSTEMDGSVQRISSPARRKPKGLQMTNTKQKPERSADKLNKGRVQRLDTAIKALWVLW